MKTIHIQNNIKKKKKIVINQIVPEFLFERVIKFEKQKNLLLSLLRWRNWLQIL